MSGSDQIKMIINKAKLESVDKMTIPSLFIKRWKNKEISYIELMDTTKMVIRKAIQSCILFGIRGESFRSRSE